MNYLSLTIQIILWTLSILTGTFIFWRRAEKEINTDQLWTLMLKAIFGALIIGRISWFVFQFIYNQKAYQMIIDIINHSGIDVFGSLFGAMIAININSQFQSSTKNELKDNLIEGFAWTAILIYTYHYLTRPYLYNLYILTLSLINLFIWYWIKSNYRKWHWYYSGKVGFLWWTGIILISLTLLTHHLITSTVTSTVKIVYFNIPLIMGIIKSYQISGRKYLTDIRSIQKYINLIKNILKQKIRKKS